jgi:hypothetical protein
VRHVTNVLRLSDGDHIPLFLIARLCRRTEAKAAAGHAAAFFVGQNSAMNGSLQLREYPGEMVRLSCAKCDDPLIERYGADICLPDMREEIAQCRRHGQMHDACMVRYIDLVPQDASQ